MCISDLTLKTNSFVPQSLVWGKQCWINHYGKVMNGKNNLIQSNGKFTAVLGLSDLVVVNTDDATLIVPRDKVEDVKDLVAFLKKDGQNNLI